MTCWTIAVFFVLLSIVHSCQGVCAYYINGTFVESFEDSFSSFYYCCSEEDRICTKCCSFSLVWPTVVVSILVFIIFVLVLLFILYRWKRERERMQEGLMRLQNVH